MVQMDPLEDNHNKYNEISVKRKNKLGFWVECTSLSLNYKTRTESIQHLFEKLWRINGSRRIGEDQSSKGH